MSRLTACFAWGTTRAWIRHVFLGTSGASPNQLGRLGSQFSPSPCAVQEVVTAEVDQRAEQVHCVLCLGHNKGMEEAATSLAVGPLSPPMLVGVELILQESCQDGSTLSSQRGTCHSQDKDHLAAAHARACMGVRLTGIV